MRHLNFKNIVLVGFLLIEIMIFGAAYLFGKHGIKQVKLAQAENEQLLEEVQALKQSVEKLEKQLSDWETNSFYKEQIARERLNLSKSNEQIYYLD
jgi:cell division protein FtsB